MQLKEAEVGDTFTARKMGLEKCAGVEQLMEQQSAMMNNNCSSGVDSTALVSPVVLRASLPRAPSGQVVRAAEQHLARLRLQAAAKQVAARLFVATAAEDRPRSDEEEPSVSGEGRAALASGTTNIGPHYTDHALELLVDFERHVPWKANLLMSVELDAYNKCKYSECWRGDACRFRHGGDDPVLELARLRRGQRFE